MPSVSLPAADRTVTRLVLGEPAKLDVRATPPTSRQVYAASHVVADPLRASGENVSDQIDWEGTLRLRRDLWSLGLGVAESMDTAQRGMGLDWTAAKELAVRTLAEAKSVGGTVVVGVGTDQLKTERASLAEIRDAYIEQIDAIESSGGDVVMMASRHLARAAAGPDDYRTVYDAVLSAARRPVILHWLGTVFDSALDGYWGAEDPSAAMDTVVEILDAHRDKVRGIKVSLLDQSLEIALRERMPAGVRVFTGDDYNYVDLIAGDGTHSSDALLGAFAAIGPFASAAFARLDAGDIGGFKTVLGPTESLSRLIFTSPTQYYKVGVAWLAYLTGKQNHFRMIGGFETGRSLLHLADLVRAADALGLFPNPDLAADRASAYFAVHGID
ncbi:dihydrodipicolinate synthase family protein [Rhodococcus spongiicola]|uniref:Dihydrodipicolinate synthase family protein n=1 Tax=Rhodococcus spongiicola TaxID=2487352 RepID=A0A3S3AAY6_9NOCA|nr:dihydrodipicolinate synthase family protein [Rhodococcus spongiicola]RVW05998.1 dihydrodipicolinate synthase family protein [Rhodococcus spongiicola]